MRDGRVKRVNSGTRRVLGHRIFEKALIYDNVRRGVVRQCPVSALHLIQLWTVFENLRERALRSVFSTFSVGSRGTKTVKNCQKLSSSTVSLVRCL